MVVAVPVPAQGHVRQGAVRDFGVAYQQQYVLRPAVGHEIGTRQVIEGPIALSLARTV